MSPRPDEGRVGSSEESGSREGDFAGVAVLSPVGRDAELIVQALATAGIAAFAVPSAGDLLRLISEEVHGIGPSRLAVVLTTDHALGVEWSRRLVEVLDRQPAWSDIPIVLLAGGGSAADPFHAGPIARRLPVGSSVTVLDRPVRMAALVSAVRAARRARNRQLEVRDLIETRDRALAEVEKANRAKSEYLAIMSHEVRSPLNAIMGHVQIIEMGVHGPVSAAQRDALKRIQQAQQHILRMADDLLEYARIEAGRLEYRIESVGVREAVDEVLGLVEARLESSGLSWSAHLPEARVVLRADPDRLRQVLLNLLSNASKFTPSGGRVDVAASAGDDVVHIEVRDTGVGIPKEKLAAIFEPFVQAHRHDTELEDGGTGLGLAISREMVRSMHGDLTVSSTVGEGSTFTVTLPRAHASGGGSETVTRDAEVTPAEAAARPFGA